MGCGGEGACGDESSAVREHGGAVAAEPGELGQIAKERRIVTIHDQEFFELCLGSLGPVPTTLQ